MQSFPCVLVKMCLFFSQMWQRLGFLCFIPLPTKLLLFNVYTVTYPRWPKGKIMYVTDTAWILPLLLVAMRLWGHPCTPPLLPCWPLRGGCSEVALPSCTLWGWNVVGREIRRPTGSPFLLFSDQGAGKLSCLSEELVKEVAVSKGAERQIWRVSKLVACQVYWHMPSKPALGWQRQKDGEFKASLDKTRKSYNETKQIHGPCSGHFPLLCRRGGDIIQERGSASRKHLSTWWSRSYV